MSYHKLFVSQSNIFGGFQKTFDQADYVIFGVPFDVTSTYRRGAKFAPNAIREASLNIETYSFRTGLDLEDLKIHDLGDLDVLSSVEKTLERLELVVKEILERGKKLVVIGGEHTITFGIAKGFKNIASETALISFDAHLDLREEFLGLKISHTTFMRRINEEIKPAKILEVGTRAVCREELKYAEKAGIEFFTVHQIRKQGIGGILRQLKEKLNGMKNVYLSIDMDVLDPGFAPAVQNPEPEGLEPHILIDILSGLCDEKVIGFDVVEVTPPYDHGTSAIQAAKIILEVLCQMENSRRSKI
ncbi:agmatinase [Candidatus Bathyarchaeota archaeon]|nr:MAG: agmatinase [Candidatus Bathyarchaeota archaeon]